MNEKDKSNFTNSIVGFISRYNLIIFIIIIVSGLSVAVITIKNIVQQAYDNKTYSNNSNEVKFDETTITNINRLYESKSNPNDSISNSGRMNIFSK